MIYQTEVRGTALFQAQSAGYGEPVATFGVTEQGETPVSLVTIALASCVTMCVQGYFAKHHQKKDVQVSVAVSYDDDSRKIKQTVKLDQELSEEMVPEILAYIDDRCKVKKLLREDLEIETVFALGED